MLNFSRFRILSILAVVLLGALFAFPNLLSKQAAEGLPGWLPNGQINLGLDLQGGQYLLLNVGVEETVEADLKDLRASVPQVLIDAGTKGRATLDGDAVVVTLNDESNAAAASDALFKDLSQPVNTGFGAQANIEITQGSPGVLELRFTETAIKDRRDQVMAKTLEVIRKRVDALGTREPTIQRQGDQRVLVEIPGGGFDTDIFKEQAKLTFHMVDTTVSQSDLRRKRVRAGYEVMEQASNVEGGAPILYAIQSRAIVDGADLKEASGGFDQQTNEPIVSFTFNQKGAKAFADVTLKNVGKPFAIVLDGKVISAPVIRSPILGGSGQISGNFTPQETTRLAIQLQSGALPASITIASERTVGPDLGADSIEAGETAALIGLAAVIVFMVLTYGGFGLTANVSLIVNLILIAGGLSLLQATLTLPGIAGIVLTIGMAVDANVLVFERRRGTRRQGANGGH
ncbi:MAG: protein translocase subunit SecD [Proteobacteria bacterium]|nr:protein translocase subunit SecD [Pseudomonadota bacterium]